MITVISTPACSVACTPVVSPAIQSYWLATESPNNFRLLRRDYLVTPGTTLDDGGGISYVHLTTPFTGQLGDYISVHDTATDAILTGVVTLWQAGPSLLYFGIQWVPGIDIDYINDNTEFSGFYFEARLVINGIVQPLTIIASPDTYGYADIDVSGVLRISTSLGKDGDYSTLVMKEETKSGNFTFEYRTRWFGKSDVEAVNPYIPLASPNVVWYYAECVRSEEQGSNLHEYVADVCNDAPFLNSFDKPVYFHGLPWDISFILPELFTVSPGVDITITIQFYNSYNTVVGAALVYTINVDSNNLDGHVVSLSIDATLVPVGATYFTAQITAP
jgi:hypothetical protein